MTADRPVPVAHPDNRWTDLLDRADNYLNTAPVSPGRRPMSYRLILDLADALRAALNGPTTTTALPDVDQTYGAMPAEFAEWTTRGQIEAVLAAVAALLAQTDTEDDQ